MLSVEIALPDVEELHKLVEQGQEKGFLTYDEIVPVLDEIDLTKEQVEDFYTYLIDHSIELVEGEQHKSPPHEQPALAELTFNKRRIARDVKKVLQSAIANAENNHQLDVDRLYVAEAYVGRAFVMKRFHARARGRAGKVVKPWSNLTVVVREREETA